MEIKFTVLGRIPSKKNSKIMVCRGKRPLLLPSSDYRAWHKLAVGGLDEQKVPKKKIKSTQGISVRFFAPDKRKFDLSNKFESIADLLVDYGLLEDDNYGVLDNILLTFGGVDNKYPRAEVEIY